MTFKSEFLNESKERGFIHQCTDLQALDELFSTTCVTAYTGFDPTGPSLHVGHLMPIMWLRLLQRTGHKPIVLLGGATSLIGDPSGKDAQRPLLQLEDVLANAQSLKNVFENVLDFNPSLSHAAIMLNNYDWLSPLQYMEFLRDYGRHFSVNRMLTFDSVKTRLDREEPLSFLEFNYMIFQAFDFLHLSRTKGCRLQMAGSDQWGNIINGVELARRVDGTHLLGLTAPLLTTSSGAKMGKTASGAVWLNEEKLSHFDFWQYWRNTADADVGRFLRVFTDLPLSEIQKLEQLKDAELNEAKTILADEVTKLVRGAHTLEQIHQSASELFSGQQTDLSTLPSTAVNPSTLPIPFEDFVVTHSLVASKGEIRRLIQGGGVKMNDTSVTDAKQPLTAQDFCLQARLKISIGKKKHFIFSVA